MSERVPPPPGLARVARSRLFDDRPFDRRFRSREADPDRRSGRGPEERRERFGGPFMPPAQGSEFVLITVNGSVVGIVAVPIAPPPLSMALRDLGPTLALVALGLLAMGTAIAALVIFRPARRRLTELQAAARALGAGEIGVRAAESGGDEVTALSRGFNEMATELEERTLALERANRIRRQLLADVSHELITPLAAIRGYVETLGMSDLALDRRDPRAAISGSSTTRPSASSTSSAICSIWRGSKVAAAPGAPRKCRFSSCSSACVTATNRPWLTSR